MYNINRLIHSQLSWVLKSIIIIRSRLHQFITSTQSWHRTFSRRLYIPFFIILISFGHLRNINYYLRFSFLQETHKAYKSQSVASASSSYKNAFLCHSKGYYQHSSIRKLGSCCTNQRCGSHVEFVLRSQRMARQRIALSSLPRRLIRRPWWRMRDVAG